MKPKTTVEKKPPMKPSQVFLGESWNRNTKHPCGLKETHFLPAALASDLLSVLECQQTTHSSTSKR